MRRPTRARATDAPDAGLEVVVSPMRRRDLRSVLRIEAHNDTRPWSLGLFMSELRMRTGRVYVVARAGGGNGQVAGFAGLLLSGSDAHVTTIAVHPDWRGRQIGTRLMLVLARAARARGMRALTLEVRVGNAAAQALYRRLGLVPAGMRKNYYSDIGEDALIMWAHDIDTDEYARRLEEIERGLPSPTLLEGFESQPPAPVREDSGG